MEFHDILTYWENNEVLRIISIYQEIFQIIKILSLHLFSQQRKNAITTFLNYRCRDHWWWNSRKSDYRNLHCIDEKWQT